jgi:anti-sigma factor ChrR (cupin superfamily)
MSENPDDAPLNGDLSRRICVDTAAMDWTASPSGSVLRKRVHRVGPAESGQVTSVVRYEPDSEFPPHDHPEGEEILVLEGVFSDEHGDWPAGTYLLNPEGFRHAPFSREGCLLFVKLRQYPGLDRLQLQLQTRDSDWQQTGKAGRHAKSLYRQAGFEDHMRLERWDAGATPGILDWSEGVELFVIDGEFSDADGNYAAGSWLRLPPGSRQEVHTGTGCELYIKEAGFGVLRSG